jgi:hypothetical protein
MRKLFDHPMSGNIDVKKLLQALEYYGAEVGITKHNRAKIFLKNEELILTLSHNNELTKDVASKLKHFLEKVGLTPDKL